MDVSRLADLDLDRLRSRILCRMASILEAATSLEDNDDNTGTGAGTDDDDDVDDDVVDDDVFVVFVN